jgi:hypothetical protein
MLALAAYREKYPGFGPEFAAEKLKENEGIAVSSETLRQWLIAAGLWERKKKPPVPEPAGTPSAFRGTGAV